MNPMIAKVMTDVKGKAAKAKADGGLGGLKLLIDCGVDIMKSARMLERQLHATHPSAGEQWAVAAKLFREDIVSFATHHSIDQNLIAGACSKFAAACSMRALRMTAEIPHLRKKAAQGGASSSSASSKDKDYMSEPVRHLRVELLQKAAESGGALSLLPEGIERLDQMLKQLLEFSFAIEGHDFGLVLDRVSSFDDHHPEWLRTNLPSLDDFATLDSKQLVDLGAKLQGLAERLAFAQKAPPADDASDDDEDVPLTAR